ncbi:MAG TPA: hypothetical protein VF433_10460, partial [Cellvibrio sp.]
RYRPRSLRCQKQGVSETTLDKSLFHQAREDQGGTSTKKKLANRMGQKKRPTLLSVGRFKKAKTRC